MLYLEDYLELLEHLPRELRDRFTDIREKDLQVQNSTQQLQEKKELFFAGAKKLKPEQRQCEYEKLLKEYETSMSYADKKVEIATNLTEIMQKLINKLDNDIDKFKVELEASSSSICERASLIAGGDSIHMNGLNMNGSTRASSVCSDSNGTLANGGHYENNLSSFGNNNSFKNSSSLHQNNKSNLQNISTNLSDNTINYNNKHQHSALSATLAAANNNSNLNSALASMMYASVQNQKISNNTTLYHRNETKYCLCRQVSYGEMVACDNNECEFEWFHYDCVNITRPPKGKWYCPNCLPIMNGHNQNHHSTSTAPIINQPKQTKTQNKVAD